jgi:gas vesicle protein
MPKNSERSNLKEDILMNRDNAIGFFGIGLLAGAIIGGALALLYAPQSGSATRKQIMDKATEVEEALKEKSGDLMDSVKHSVAEANRKGHAAAYAIKH